MIRINLLPHRERKRLQQQQLFLGGLVLLIVVAALLYYGIYQIFAQRVADAQAQVDYLQQVTKELDQKIASVADLRKKRDALLAREKIITTLQDRRDLTVRIFNALAAITPKGVFLSKLEQTGDNITVTGYAESNDQVAAFMRQIESSSTFTKPTLNIISKSKLGSDEVKQFTLQMMVAEPNVSAGAKS